MATRDLNINIGTKFEDKGTTAAEEGLKKTEAASKRAQVELERVEKAAVKQQAAVERAAVAQQAAAERAERAAVKQQEQTERAAARQLAAMERAAANSRAAMETSGQAVATFGVVALAGIGMAVKAAVEWESAWAGVTKTVEGTPQQMAALEGSLRSLARELPSSHKEIAAVAEAAGQLGIKRESIVSFTRTMIALGQTTDLSAEQAATALARLSNVMGTPQQDIDKLGSSLVALGNAGASTESEIVAMGLRIAGAGEVIGLSEGQVLGFASALSSVGIEAESGGSSISRVMITIAQAVDNGGASVEKFARVAGMSASDFSSAFRDDAGGALASFIEGLGNVEASGGSLFQTLQQLGFSEVEVRDALLRTASAGSLLTDSLRLGEKAWEDNSALTEEAAKRYETTASKMKVAENNITDLGITIGEAFLPVLGAAAEHTSGWIAMLQDLPAPVKTAGGVVVGLAGTLALTGGAAMIAVPKMVEFTKTLADMGPRGAAMATRLSSLGAFLMGPWGIALAAAAGAMVLFADSKAQAAAKVDTFRAAIEADSGALAAHTREAVIARLSEEGMLEISQRLGINLELLTDAAMGNKDAFAQVIAQVTAAQGPADAFHTKVRSLSDGTKALSGDQKDLQQRLQGINGDLTKGAESDKAQQQAMGASGTAAKSLTSDLSIQGVAAQDLNKFMSDLSATYGLVGDDSVKAASTMINAWSQAFTSFGNMAGAISDIESASSGSGNSGAERQAAAAERLAEVQRTSAEKIKGAQRDVADAHERAADQAVQSQERISASHEALASAVEQAAEREASAIQGVADAAEQVSASHEALASAVEQAAQREASAIQGVADSAEQVSASHEALAAVVEKSAEREAAAVQGIADARQRAAEVAEDSSRKIESAVQRVSDAQTEAADRELAAESRLQDSHARTTEAVEDLTAAREHAAERLEDLARSSASGALDEEGAQIAIERARERLAEVNADPKSTALDRQETDLAYRRAVERLEEIKRRNADLRQEISESNAAGIEGATEVVQAKERIAAAQGAEQEAEAALAKQREESARAVASAELALVDARRDASRQQEDASRALAEAEAAANQTRIDSAKDVLRAQRDISDAEKDAAAASAALDQTRINGAKDVVAAQRDITDAEKDAAAASAELDRTRIDSAKEVRRAKEDIATAEAEAAKATKASARDVADAEETVRKARADSAADQKKANADVRDSWVDLGGTVSVTTGQLLEEMETQVKAQEEWADNLISLAGRVPDEMLKELAELGPGGAKVVALASEMSDKELAKFIELHGRSGKAAGDVFAENLASAAPVLREIARTRGQEVADKVREGMDNGRVSVFEAARRLSVEIDSGLELDRKRTLVLEIEAYNKINGPPATARESGGIDRYAQGGLRFSAPMIASRPTVLFGEGRAPEAFIPYDQQYRARAEGLLSQVAGDFGGVYLRPQGATSAPTWTAPAAGGGRPSSSIHIEHFHAAGQDPHAIAEDFYFLSTARGY